MAVPQDKDLFEAAEAHLDEGSIFMYEPPVPETHPPRQEEAADYSAAAAPVLASGFKATLGDLPDRPPTGTHRVARVHLDDLDAWNDALQNGWRIVQMIATGAPDEFVVALRYAGYAA